MRRLKKVSVIIPMYNVEKYIEKCVMNIVNQNYSNIEIVLIDDGSTDNTFEISKKLEEKFTCVKVYGQENKGVSAARNYGIFKSTGELIYFVDADDELLPNAIKKMVYIFENYDVDVVRGKYLKDGKIFEKEENIIKKYKISGNLSIKNSIYIANLLLTYQLNCAVWLIMVRKEILEKVSFLKWIGYGEDLIFTFDVFNQTNKIYFLDDIIYNYIESTNSASRAPSLYKRNIENLVELSKIVEEKIKKSNFNEYISYEKTCDVYSYMAIWYVFQEYENSLINKDEFYYQLEKLYSSFGSDTKIADLKEKSNIKIPLHIAVVTKLFKIKKYGLIMLLFRIKRMIRH